VSDLAVPSWRTRPEKQGPSWRMLAIAGGLLGAAALVGAVGWGVSRSGPRTVPVIEPDVRPIKVRPENPGGLIVPNQDQMILEPPAVRRESERRGNGALLDSGPETPQLDVLRRQAAPGVPLPAPVATAPASATAPSSPPATASKRTEIPCFSGRGRQEGTARSLTASPRRA